MKRQTIISALAAISLLTACGTSRQMIADNSKTPTQQEAKSDNRRAELAFIQKVSDNAAYQKRISSKISFSLNKGEKNINIDGQINMQRDEVIRIQLTALGLVEVGRLEFRPNDVLILIRPTKEYILASYDEIDFLKKNGLNFYSLQALFWNQLFVPGTNRVSQQMLEQFSADIATSDQSVPIGLKDGNMTYQWTAERKTGNIVKAVAQYDSKSTGQSSLEWIYSDFAAIGSKKFPTNNQFTLTTNAASADVTKINVGLKLKKIETNADFETRTEVSSKYKKISVEQAVKRIMSL